ncbi:unnamed protein product [Parascedosporium putredinis]|uniref:Zn(2)-C6 fungal-type domain-containing protein n=1 Tax=Parascedosporium putredinis TaxID=1442378 RepID=A0A9P1MFF9_9PEZI|nr:unnamed protein product [Parascedosporium putredinis]CAI8002286.1 unnamed protein product [Parascedosporium putredinis]
MLQEGDEPQEGSRKSIIACHSCRKRKVKCDREYPSCQVCEQTGQDCNYPLKPKKPGPKIGSLQRQKRRYQERQMQQNGDQPLSRKSTSPPGPADEDLDMHSAIDLDGEDSDSQMGNVRNPEWTTKRRNSKLNINSLSFILHPSHEASTPKRTHPPLPRTRQSMKSKA